MKVTEIVFDDTGRARLTVEISPDRTFSTQDSPQIPRLLFRLLPGLAAHRCHNDAENSFRREAEATELPHLLEHIILEIQNQVRRGQGVPLAGETVWNWTTEPRGRFSVFVNYDDEIVALGAIRLAERLLEAADTQDLAGINMARDVSRLREIWLVSRRLSPPPARRPASHAETPSDSSPEESDGVSVIAFNSTETL